jgi:DNA-binding beta-propeller fold protein YncE
VYIIEGGDKIRVVDRTSNIIATIAGTADSTTYTGDGGPAIYATFNSVLGMAIDTVSKILYLADSGNNAIRAINLTSGIINTVAGNGTKGYHGDGGLAKVATLNRPNGVDIDMINNLCKCTLLLSYSL